MIPTFGYLRSGLQKLPPDPFRVAGGVHLGVEMLGFLEVGALEVGVAAERGEFGARFADARGECVRGVVVC